MIDWGHLHAVLRDGTRTALATFFSRAGRDDVCAVGYVFELWNYSPSFNLCADRWSHRRRCSDWPSEEARWNSGGYEFPAALSELAELGRKWETFNRELHRLAADERHSREVYDGLVRVGCLALADLGREGFFGDWTGLDFNVSEVNDSLAEVASRNALIRQWVASPAEQSYVPTNLNKNSGSGHV